MHKTDSERVYGGHRVVADQKMRPRFANAANDKRRDHCGDDSKPYLRQAEYRLFAGNGCVAGTNKPESSADGSPVDARDNGFGA